MLAGLELDRVLEVSSTGTQMESVPWVKERLSLDENILYRYTNETVDTAWLRTCCADLTLFDPANLDARWDSSSVEKVNHLADVERGDKYMAFIVEMMDRNLHSRLFVTQNGRLGTAHKGIQAGDVVSLMLGGEVPLVLRPNRAKYKFIGECYVHGFMDGEGLVESRMKEDLEYDGKDRAWLHHLHEDPLLCEAQKFIIE